MSPEGFSKPSAPQEENSGVPELLSDEEIDELAARPEGVVDPNDTDHRKTTIDTGGVESPDISSIPPGERSPERQDLRNEHDANAGLQEAA